MKHDYTHIPLTIFAIGAALLLLNQLILTVS